MIMSLNRSDLDYFLDTPERGVSSIAFQQAASEQGISRVDMSPANDKVTNTAAYRFGGA